MGSGTMAGGFDGWNGPSLSVAAVGAQGAQGAQGFQGAAGAQGSQGNTGAQGAAGAVGAQGSQGLQGAVGAQGSQGSQGPAAGFAAPADIGPNEGVAGVAATTIRSDAIPGQKIQAAWPIANVRWYAIDGTNGSDSNAGFSDVSSAAAGLVAKQTFAGLAAIFPCDGRGRKVVVRIAAATYVGGLDVFLAGCIGYAANFPLILPTITSATAGCTAFDASVADKIMAGFVNCTGMNVAGYNPVAPLDPATIKCLTVAAGAPGFPAEAAAPLPMGIRMRFDAATTTVALRNFCVPIIGIPATDTLLVPNNVDGGTAGGLPATPVASDVFYLEMPGVNCDPTTLGIASNGGSVQNGAFGFPQIVGVSCSAFKILQPLRITGCVSAFTSNCQVSGTRAYVDETGTLRQVGFGLRCAGALIGQYQGIGGYNYSSVTENVVVTGLATVSHSLAQTFSDGSYFAAGLLLFAVRGEVTTDPAVVQPGSLVGAKTVNLQSAVRVRGSASIPTGGQAGVGISFCEVQIGRLDVESAGAHPAIQLIGYCALGVSSALTGSTGNTDVGMDLTSSVGSVIVVTSAPTVTGTAGDIRLSDGTIATWAQVAATGLTDKAGNRFIAAGVAPLQAAKFSGGILGGAGATTSYMADTGAAPAVNLTTIQYPTSLRLLTRLNFQPLSNTFVTTVTATLYKNNVATAMTVNIPAGSTAFVRDIAHVILFSDGDTFSVVLGNASDAGKTLFGCATVEGPS